MVRPRTTTDQQILDEARACFLEHGAGVATTLIAARIGVSHATLFQRFGTKEKLMRAALQPPLEQPWFARVRSGPDDRALPVQLLELAQEIYTFLERIVPSIAVLRSAGITVESVAERPEDIPPVRARREVAAWFSRATKRGLVRKIKPEHAADLLLGALHFRPFYQHISRKNFSRADSRAYLDVAVDAISRTLDPAEDGRDASDGRGSSAAVRRPRRR